MRVLHRQLTALRWLTMSFIAVLLGLSASSAVARDTYSLAIVPQYSPLTVHRNWQPLLKALEKDTGIKLKLRVYNSFNRFIGGLERGDADFAYLAPYHLVVARETQPYVPLLRDGTRDLIGVVVVRKDSPYTKIEDLHGKQIDFPSPNAFAASLYLRAHLREKLGLDYTPRYVGNHDNVYRHVALGLSEGGGGVNNTLSQQPKTLKGKLRVLYEVPGVASHPLAAHQRVPEDVRNRIQQAILSWSTRPERQALLKAVQLATPVPASYSNDYKNLETLGLEKYLVEPGR